MAAESQGAASEDFAERQARNRRLSALIVFLFICLFLLIGSAVDYLYFDAFTPSALKLPVATLTALAMAAAISLMLSLPADFFMLEEAKKAP